jgi:hypothetical protein
MTFSISRDSGVFKRARASLRSVFFPQAIKHAFDPWVWCMLFDIAHSNSCPVPVPSKDGDPTPASR